MKTVMKKIFSLMLVAVLLVSAVPFAASADEVTATLCLITERGGDVIAQAEITVNTEDVLGSVTAEANALWGAQYTFEAGSTEIKEGNRVYARMTPKQSEPVTLTCSTCGGTYTEGTEHSCPTVTCSTCNESYTQGAEHECPTLTCDSCKETYTKGTNHTCPDMICDTCKESYKKGTSHTCETLTCNSCKESYTKGTDHTCPSVTCPECKVTYTKGDKHECPTKTTYTVKFVVDGETFWSVKVLAGNTVYLPGIEQSTTWEVLKKVGSEDDRAFKGWSTDPKATTGFAASDVAILPVVKNTKYYAIYEDVAVEPPTSSNENGITNKDNTNKVYLHVYLNGNASVIQLTKDITESDLLADNKTSNGEIWTYLTKHYYTAKDTSLGVQIDGLYVNTGSSGTFPQNYYTDKKVSELNDISSLLDKGYVHINVMMKNVAVSTNYTADSSNPKTGDMIFAPVMVLGLSASALAVLFFLNKKRAY